MDRYMHFCGEHEGKHRKGGIGDGNKNRNRRTACGNVSESNEFHGILPVSESHIIKPASAFATVTRSHTTTNASSPNQLSQSKQATQVSSLDGQHVHSVTAEVSAILLCMRKLREGMLASRRMDQFVKEAYIFFVRAAIFLGSVESYLPAIVRLLEVIHLHVRLSKSELSEFAGYYVLHFACRLEDYSQAFEIRKKYQVKDLRIDQAITALIHNNYWSFRTARRKVDAYKGVLMDCAERRFREDTLKCLARAYHVLEVEYVEVVTGCPWEKVKEEYNVGWPLYEDGKKVMVRKKPRRNLDTTGV